MERKTPIWELEPLLGVQGLKAFNLHPIHILLNAIDLTTYHRVRDSVPRAGVISAADTEGYAGRGARPRSTFHQIVAYLAEHGGGVWIRDLTTGVPT